MIPHHLKSSVKALKLGLNSKIIFFVYFFSCSLGYAQDEEFELLPEEEVLHFRYELYTQSIGFFFSHIPSDLMHEELLIHNASKGGTVGFEISTSIFENRQALVEFNSGWQRSDTFFISIDDRYMGINYIPQKIIPGVTPTEIKMGANCYILRCEPENDPWMPNGNKPFLFSRDDYYVNPKNGKALKGERILNSGRYSACELENWALVYSDEIDTDKENWKLKKKKTRQNK
jgi:hypothetical protein